jgi:hypothetical protein
LGLHRYYFNQNNIPPIQGITNNDAMKHLVFTSHKFYTNKSLSNAFGEHLFIVKKRVDNFINNSEWYSEKGIPHTLGILPK